MKYEKWSLGYWFLKQYVGFAEWLIYKNIIVLGKEKIPNNKPILFTPNHQNALSDPLAVLLNTKFQPVWLARADIFKKPFVRAILRFLKLMPVYRLRDGKENLVKNDKVFYDSVKVLEHNFALALFPEAAHSGKRQMLPHKKAVPRIVWMAEEKSNFKLDIQIIPTGIYYSSYWKFNRNLIVKFGEPIPVQNYIAEFKENPGAATLSLRDKIHEALLPLVMNIKSKKFYLQIETIIETYGAHFLRRQKIKNTALHLFESNRKLANELDKLSIEKPEVIEAIIFTLNKYVTVLKNTKIRSWLIEKPKNNFIKFVRNKLMLLVGLPVFLYGFILNAFPFFLIDKFVRKKVKDKSFWSTFFLVLGLVVFPVFYLIELYLISPIIPGFWFKLLFLFSLPFAGKLAFIWYILFRKTIGRFRLLWLKHTDKPGYQKLFATKEALFQQLDEVISI